ncbi:MAG: hypothetical protein ABFC96_06630 [Thermoguttaceae bacterium]
MFTIAFCFLGIAGFIVAALACVWMAGKSDPSISVDVGGLHAAAACISEEMAAGDVPSVGDRSATPEARAKRREAKELWMEWYAKCVEEVASRQKAFYSWARTLALCAAMSLVGVVMEAYYGEPISLSGIVAGLRGPRPVSASLNALGKGKDHRAVAHPLREPSVPISAAVANGQLCAVEP